jgi:hypothetical protein
MHYYARTALHCCQLAKCPMQYNTWQWHGRQGKVNFSSITVLGNKRLFKISSQKFDQTVEKMEMTSYANHRAAPKAERILYFKTVIHLLAFRPDPQCVRLANTGDAILHCIADDHVVDHGGDLHDQSATIGPFFIFQFRPPSQFARAAPIFSLNTKSEINFWKVTSYDKYIPRLTSASVFIIWPDNNKMYNYF